MNTSDKNLPAEADEYGPAMSACLPKEQLFILALLEGKSGAQSAREAGYGNEDGSSSSETMARISHRTLTRGRVIDALTEQSRKTIRSLAPTAIQAVRDILTQTTHKDRAKVALNLIERMDPTVQRTDVNVTHQIIDRRKDLLEAFRIAKQLGASPEKLIENFGYSAVPELEKQLALADGNIVEGEFTEITPVDLEADIQRQMEDL